MNKNNHAIAMCLVSAGLLAACGSNDDDDTSSNPETETLSEKYQGTYAIACTTNFAGAFTESLTITGQTGTLIETEFSDAQCVTPTSTNTTTADISFPGGTQTTARGEADFYDTVLTGLNRDGVPQDLSPVSADERSEFGIVLLDGVNLYLGDTDDGDVGSTADTRPTDLEDVPYVRQ